MGSRRAEHAMFSPNFREAFVIDNVPSFALIFYPACSGDDAQLLKQSEHFRNHASVVRLLGFPVLAMLVEPVWFSPDERVVVPLNKM